MNTEQLSMPAGQFGYVTRFAPHGKGLRPHVHAELELNLAYKGEATYIVDGRRVQISPRTLLWLFPDQNHALVDANPDFEAWVVVFGTQLTKQAGAEPDHAMLNTADPGDVLCRSLPLNSANWLDQLFAELDRTNNAPESSNAGLYYALLSAWSHYVNTARLTFDEVHPAVERAVQLLQHSNPLPDLADTAQQVGLSDSRLCRLFRQQVGVSMVDFRNRVRIDRFLQHYGKGQRFNMLEAAYEAGFGSYAQFYRVFNQVMGCTPSAYRRTLFDI